MESMVHRERWERDTPECDRMGAKRPYNSLHYTERRSQLVFQKDTRKRTPHQSQQFPPKYPKEASPSLSNAPSSSSSSTSSYE